jgi:Tol biopolymer transport system component
MAQPFSTSKLATTGDAVPVAEQVDVVTSGGAALGHFSASQNGVLMYTSSGGRGGNVQLTWFDRTGKKLYTAGAPGNLQWFSISPDGASIAVTRQDPQTGKYDIWTRDLMHQSESRLTFMGNNRFPVWSADGTHIFFWSDRDGALKTYQKAANGTGQVELVDAANRLLVDASRDGHYLFTITPNNNPKTGNDIWVHPLFGDRKQFPYVATEFQEVWPRLSPDGHWLAYQSNESQQFQIYVVSFPQPGGKWQISATGGTDPVWSHDGRELYYYSADNKIMAVNIKPGPQFQFGEPKGLFEANISTNNISFDVSKDGRFLLPVLGTEQAATVPMTVVLNWQAGLKK